MGIYFNNLTLLTLVKSWMTDSYGVEFGHEEPLQPSSLITHCCLSLKTDVFRQHWQKKLQDPNMGTAAILFKNRSD